MPFDGAQFSPRRQPAGPAGPSGNTACIIIVALAFSLLVLPISLPALVDLVRVLQGR